MLTFSLRVAVEQETFSLALLGTLMCTLYGMFLSLVKACLPGGKKKKKKKDQDGGGGKKGLIGKAWRWWERGTTFVLDWLPAVAVPVAVLLLWLWVVEDDYPADAA